MRLSAPWPGSPTPQALKREDCCDYNTHFSLGGPSPTGKEKVGRAKPGRGPGWSSGPDSNDKGLAKATLGD